ncbi:DUF5916 domain-containing protein [Polaribacter gochangensis]|uniref:DUF5916 domain-containing protein n=1 Tax=Polaribacter gochangensis TaxID=3252903 RepID=UPI0039046A69
MKKNLFLILIISCTTLFAQKTKQVFVKYIKTDISEISIDGLLSEAHWAKAKTTSNYWQYFPSDSLKANNQTEVKMMFDDKNLYVAIKVHAKSNDFIIPSLRRDFRASGNDNVTLIFDTFNDGSNAFFFGTNPAGVKREALLSGGGTDLRGFNLAWDTKWVCKTQILDDAYIAEIAIPLTAFKFREGETKWRFNSYQFDTQDNEQNTWMNIPQNQYIFSLAYMGEMIFEKPLGKSRAPIAIIPYINTFSGKDFENNSAINDVKIGGDAKFAIGNSMNLDVTINPDFSQVEVDQQTTNLTRFEISLPERRQFFIENSDLFGDFGDSRDENPFFSRRIGIAKNKSGESIENGIVAGARLSGKLNNNLRLGILSVQTEEDVENEIPATNNSVVAIQQKLFSRSNLSFLFINKQATKEYGFLKQEDKYNRVIGIDYNLASENNTWNGRYFIHKSFSPTTTGKDISAGISTEYNSRNFKIKLSGIYIEDDFRSDLGFIKRTDIFKINPNFEYTFYPKKGEIQKHTLSVTPIYIWKPELGYKNSDYTIISQWNIDFNNSTNLEFSMFNRYTYLYDSFDPTRTNSVELPANVGYSYTSFEAKYRSDIRKQFSFDISPSIGQFYNGNKYSLEGNLNWRIEPFFQTKVQVNYNYISLPDPYANASIWLVGPRFDVTFNKNLFWNTLIQYSNQEQSLSVNSRLQWRFAPLSDLFIAYNDNYDTNSPLSPRFRSINLKLSYWLNL